MPNAGHDLFEVLDLPLVNSYSALSLCLSVWCGEFAVTTTSHSWYSPLPAAVFSNTCVLSLQAKPVSETVCLCINNAFALQRVSLYFVFALYIFAVLEIIMIISTTLIY